MNWLSDLLFWLLLIFVIFSGCYLVISGLGSLVVNAVPEMTILLPKVVLVLSGLLTPLALAGLIVFVKKH